MATGSGCGAVRSVVGTTRRDEPSVHGRLVGRARRVGRHRAGDHHGARPRVPDGPTRPSAVSGAAHVASSLLTMRSTGWRPLRPWTRYDLAPWRSRSRPRRCAGRWRVGKWRVGIWRVGSPVASVGFWSTGSIHSFLSMSTPCLRNFSRSSIFTLLSHPGEGKVLPIAAVRAMGTYCCHVCDAGGLARQRLEPIASSPSSCPSRPRPQHASAARQRPRPHARRHERSALVGPCVPSDSSVPVTG